MSTTRPVFVSAIAILYFVVSLAMLVLLTKSLAGTLSGTADRLNIEGAVFVFVPVIAAGLGCAWGLWKVANWARVLAMLTSGVGAFPCIIGLVSSVKSGTFINVFVNAVALAVATAIIVYLLLPRVKHSFQRADMPSILG